MATSKTPPLQRINRAEKSATGWKKKATLRREGNERLQLQINALQEKALILAQQTRSNKDLQTKYECLENELKNAQNLIEIQKKELEDLKKKSPVRGSKTI